MTCPWPCGSRFLRTALAPLAAGFLVIAAPSLVLASAEEPDSAALEESKRLFGEAQKAMSDDDYVTAQAKFSEAYRLAPHLHVFNYNIAVAAQLAGDCRTAQLTFQSFLDLVPDHPERKDATRRLEKLKRDCPVDLESESVLTNEGQAKRDEERTFERAIAAMNDLLVQLQWGEDFYRATNESFAHASLRRAAARKKGQTRQLRKLMGSHRVPDQQREPLPLVIPENLSAGCRKGRSHEGRIERATLECLRYFETKPAVRLLNKILRTSERDADAFDDCVHK